MLWGERAEDDSHGREVARIADSIAAAMGFEPRTRERLRLAARLHDIGKLEIDDAILEKPGDLDAEEWAQVRLHPLLGAQICLGEGLGDIAAWVRSHHERPDGTGYPDGLAGDAIPIEARILAVADAFDAMTSNRPYRLALSLEAAYHELEAHSGTQFDPVVVATFLRLARREKLADRDDRYLARIGGQRA